ncbi:GNAT family N-acetyltransferase [Azospirillum sp. sgz302134]
MGAPLPDLIRAARLTLRSFREEDVERFAPLIGDWEVARWLARVPHPYSLEDGRSWVATTARNRAERASLDLLVVRTDDGQPVGGVGVSLKDGELGYWLGLPYQGIGYGTEMVRALLPVAFSLGLPRLWARIVPGNDRSRRVLEKAGFVAFDQPHHYELTADRWRSITEESA